MWVDEPERTPGMAARAIERNPVAVGPYSAIDNATRLAAVNNDKRIDLRRAVTEEVFHAAQITQPLLPNIANEQQVGLCLDSGMLNRAQNAEHSHKSA